MSESTPDLIDKWLRFAHVFSQKSLEVWSKNGAGTLIIILVLVPLIAKDFVEEKSCK